jgi:hypothetical protein
VSTQEDVVKKRSKKLLTLGLFGTVLAGGAIGSDVHAQNQPSAAHLALRAKVQREGTVRVLATLKGAAPGAVTPNAMSNADAAVTRVRALGAKSARRLMARPVVVLEVDADALESVMDSGMFESVHESVKAYPTLDVSVPQIGADIAQRSGTNGLGWDVAILDTGVDNDHPSLNVVSEACFSSSGTSLCPGGASSATGTNSAEACTGNANGVSKCDHGTHVAGIAAGEGCSGTDCSPNNGVAPGAGIIAINVFHREGTAATGFKLSASDDDIIDGLDRVRALAATRKIASVNLSLGDSSANTGNCDNTVPAFKSAVDDLNALGIAVVVSAGNDGSTNTMGWPACVSNVISVANVDGNDDVAGSSNLSSVTSLMAPGVSIMSSITNGTTGGAGSKTGTSMSAPHVAGSIALLKGYDVAITASKAEKLLIDTGVDVTDQRVGGTITKPRIDTLAASEKLTRDGITSQANAKMGQAVAAGDFNNDGFIDVAVGVPGRNIGDAPRAGAVDIYYGSESGPSIVQQLSQSSEGVPGVSEMDDAFGTSLAVGDFDQNNIMDLAIGVPGESIGDLDDAGSVVIIYGSSIGLRATKLGTVGIEAQLFDQDSDGIVGQSETGDRFGWSLAAGDFNNDGRDDLAIGVPYEDENSSTDSGGVNVIYGSRAGLNATTIQNQLWTQGSDAIEGAVESADRFGAALAAGDLNGDGRDDLAIGVPGEQVGDFTTAGAVNVIYGSSTGLNAQTVADQIWTQDSSNIADSAERADAFGSSLAIGNFNRSGAADLAVGVPGEDLDGITDAGAVAILYSAGATGLASTSNQFWSQNATDIAGVAEASDRFGDSLTAGDFDADGAFDLAVGVPSENDRAGSVNVVYGSSSGLTATGNQIWNQTSTDVVGVEEAGDRFGNSLAAGDFDDDGRTDLAVGVSGEKVGDLAGAGSVNVLFGLNADGLNAAANEILSE